MAHTAPEPSASQVPAQAAKAAAAHAHEHAPTLLKDPAIERWYTMRESIHQGFRFTRYNTPAILFYAVAVPVGMYYLASATQNRWNFAGALRGDSLSKEQQKLDKAAPS